MLLANLSLLPLAGEAERSTDCAHSMPALPRSASPALSQQAAAGGRRDPHDRFLWIHGGCDPLHRRPHHPGALVRASSVAVLRQCCSPCRCWSCCCYLHFLAHALLLLTRPAACPPPPRHPPRNRLLGADLGRMSWGVLGAMVLKGLLDNVLSDYLWARAILLVGALPSCGRACCARWGHAGGTLGARCSGEWPSSLPAHTDLLH